MVRKNKKSIDDTSNNNNNNIVAKDHNSALSIQEIADLDAKLRFEIAQEYDKNGATEKCRYVMEDNGVTMQRTKLLCLNTAYDQSLMIFTQKTSKYPETRKYKINQLIRIKNNLVIQGIVSGKDFVGNTINTSFI